VRTATSRVTGDEAGMLHAAGELAASFVTGAPPIVDGVLLARL
jgi:hypothetical protein